MIPLRLDLDEKSLLKIQEAPQAVKDAIEERQKLLLEQVRHLYTEKQHELRAFVERVFADHEVAQAREAAKIEHEQNQASSMRIKSIVKRQPSTSEKRVSFSRSPPRIELFKKDSFEEEDESVLNEPKSSAASSDNETEDYSRYRPARPEFPLKLNILAKPSDSAISSSASETSDSSVCGSPAKPELVSPNFETNSAQSPTPPQSPTNDNNQAVKNGSPRSLRSPNMFPFEDMAEPPSDSRDPAGDHHKSFTSPDPDANDLHSLAEVPLFEELSEDSMIVGSAPIQIASKSHFYEPDGGKSAPEKFEESIEENSDRDLAISCNPDDILDLSSDDPSQMSFRQRMEWEKIRSTRR